jgi:hemerythrin superfamily protein
MARKTGSTPTAADATRFLEGEHREVDRLFERLRDARAPKARRDAFHAIRDALTVHARMEESVFYPAVRSGTDAEAHAQVSEALDEHDGVKELLSTIEGIDPSDVAFEERCAELQARVEHHVREEEGELFPRARDLLDADRLRTLAQRMQAFLAGARAEARPEPVSSARDERARRRGSTGK